MKNVDDFLARLPPAERTGCRTAFLLLAFARHDYHDCKGHPSLDVASYIDLLAGGRPDVMTAAAAAWIRQHVALPRNLDAPATIATTIGRLSCDVLELRYTNLDEPGSDPYVDAWRAPR